MKFKLKINTVSRNVFNCVNIFNGLCTVRCIVPITVERSLDQKHYKHI